MRARSVCVGFQRHLGFLRHAPSLHDFAAAQELPEVNLGSFTRLAVRICGLPRSP
jgi:hypothetical protein